MRLIPKPQPSPVVNWSIPRQLIDQFPAAVVVINCPPFRGTIDRLPPSQRHWALSLPMRIERPPAAVLGYAVAEPVESINRQKRHRLTKSKRRVSALGEPHVIY
jgi:hypothetical protein